MTSFHDIEVTAMNGEPDRLEKYRGKILLIVNTASKCGFTPQLKGLEELYETYRDRGLEVLGFPCNQFGRQDPGSNGEIQEFCQLNYGVSFPMHEKIDVNGDHAHPLFEHLKSAAPGILRASALACHRLLINSHRTRSHSMGYVAIL
jgi:glutathione peroxidase